MGAPGRWVQPMALPLSLGSRRWRMWEARVGPQAQPWTACTGSSKQ